MDPIALAIILAISSGATVGTAQFSKKLIFAAFEVLKTLLKKKLGSDSNVVEAIVLLEAKPDSRGRQMSLVDSLKAVNADDDPEMRDAALSLLTLLKTLPEAQQFLQAATGSGIAQADRGSTATVVIGPVRGGIAIGKNVVGKDNSFTESLTLAGSMNGFKYGVWYATNRQTIQSDSGAKGFSNKRDRDDAIHYGQCVVDIPRTHLFGSLGTKWWKRWIKFRVEDDHLKLDRIKTSQNAMEFFASIRAELGILEESEREVLVYLHGYNTTFEEAALRSAQMGFDLKINGATAFFSWPSCGTLEGYFADADRIAASEKAITDFLIRMAKEVGAKNVHIIAHSMGNRALARAMQRIFGEASTHANLRFGHIILAAPDIEVSLFRDLAAIYPLFSKHTTMYVSARDKALGLSRWLQASDRAGFTPPITVLPGIDTIEVTDIDLTLLGHGYYAEADGVIRDMFDLIHFNASPDRRARTRVAAADSRYWVIAR